jgi:iron complex outermembrane receptor protein
MVTFKSNASLLAFLVAASACTSISGAFAQGQAGPQSDAPAPAAAESVIDSPPATDTAPTIPVVALSKAEPEPAQLDAASSDAVQLEDVVVTATKRAKSVRDIPASISTFDTDKLAEQGKLGMNDYLQTKPGVTVAEIAPGLIRVTVRGITTFSSPTSPAPQGTGFLIDDVPFTDAYIANIQPDLSAFDLDSIELLKGPQGTLFGGAGLSGAVRFVLTPPTMGEWQAKTFAQYTSPSGGATALTEGVALNIPAFRDSLAFRLGYVRREHAGITDDTRAHQEDVDHGSGNQLRGLVSWQPLDALNVRFTHLQQDVFAPNEITTADTPDARETHRLILPRVHKDNFKMDSLQLVYDFDGFKVTSLSSRITKFWDLYSDGTSLVNGPPADGTPTLTGAILTVLDTSKALSQEVRVQSTDTEGFQWLAGVYVWNFKLDFIELIDTVANQQLAQPLDTSAGRPGHVTYAPNAMQTSLLYATTSPEAYEHALYVDLSDTFWDFLELSAGARLYKTQVHGGFHGTGILAHAYNYEAGGGDIDYSNNEIAEKGVSPKLSATFHFTKDLSSYLLASRGFRFGGLQSVPSTSTNNVPRTYKSDTLWNYEWGFRTSWLGNTLHFDPTVFYIDYKDPQIGQTTSGPVIGPTLPGLPTTLPGVPLGYTTNVGRAESKGAEFSLRWLTPLPGLIAEIDGGITRAKTTVPFKASDGTVIPAGAWMPGGSNKQYTAALDYLLPFSALNVGVHADYSYIGRAFTDIQNQHPVNDFATLNAGLSFSSYLWNTAPKLSLAVANITNVTKPVYWETTKPLTQMNTYDSYILNPPRTFTARLSIDF